MTLKKAPSNNILPTDSRAKSQHRRGAVLQSTTDRIYEFTTLLPTISIISGWKDVKIIRTCRNRRILETIGWKRTHKLRYGMFSVEP